MRSARVEVCRFPAPGGSTARDARDYFTEEYLETTKQAVWTNEEDGVFTIFDRTFQIELAGAQSDQWQVEEWKVTGGTHA